MPLNTLKFPGPAPGNGKDPSTCPVDAFTIRTNRESVPVVKFNKTVEGAGGTDDISVGAGAGSGAGVGAGSGSGASVAAGAGAGVGAAGAARKTTFAISILPPNWELTIVTDPSVYPLPPPPPLPPLPPLHHPCSRPRSIALARVLS